MNDLGFSEPREIQEKTLARINGGQDIVGVGPEGIGKTTTYILSVIARLKFAFEEAPRALVLVPDKEKIAEVIEKFQLLGKNTGLRYLAAIPGVGIEPQMDALADGVDVVVGTPDRIRQLYLKLGLNVNKIAFFILDDAHLLIKNGYQLPIIELSRSMPKCQHLVFSEVRHEKLEKLILPFLNFPVFTEVVEKQAAKLEIFPQQLYLVPNFKTKLNLLNLLLLDIERYNKILVLVNTKNTAERVYQRLKTSMGESVKVYNPSNLYDEGCESIEEFKGTKALRALIASNEEAKVFDPTGISYLFNVELPENTDIILERIARKPEVESPVFVNFATDIDLVIIKRIEHLTGVSMEQLPLPAGLKIETEARKQTDNEKMKVITPPTTSGAAFHQKKESNAKQHNYGYKDKMKMSGKISKRRNK